jgi:hypothetical protein
VNGKPVPAGHPRRRDDGANEYRVTLPATIAQPAKVALRIKQERGAYAGAALPEPVAFDCGAGSLAVGDWSRIAGLSSYSGGAWYRKTITLSAAQLTGPVELDLGGVGSTAEVLVNRQKAGIRLAPPYRVDISKQVKAGENRIEVLVYSALSNHYQTIPTRYRRLSPSGLLGPVRLVCNHR